MSLYYSQMETPIGCLTLVADHSGLRALRFPGPEGAPAAEPPGVRRDGVFMQAKQQLEAYFAGRLQVFSLPLVPEGTAFQQDVWSELQRIPYGHTRTYGAIAHDLGRAKAVRALGAACGRNPLPIFIPCHRVLGQGGQLTGFAGGLATKARLLQLEGALPESG